MNISEIFIRRPIMTSLVMIGILVFGLFGYAWVRGRLDPSSGMFLPQSTVFWIMGWFVLCAVGQFSQSCSLS